MDSFELAMDVKTVQVKNNMTCIKSMHKYNLYAATLFIVF